MCNGSRHLHLSSNLVVKDTKNKNEYKNIKFQTLDDFFWFFEIRDFLYKTPGVYEFLPVPVATFRGGGIGAMTLQNTLLIILLSYLIYAIRIICLL